MITPLPLLQFPYQIEMLSSSVKKRIRVDAVFGNTYV